MMNLLSSFLYQLRREKVRGDLTLGKVGLFKDFHKIVGQDEGKPKARGNIIKAILLKILYVHYFLPSPKNKTFFSQIFAT